MSKHPTATTFLHLAPADAVVYGFVMAALDEPQNKCRFYAKPDAVEFIGSILPLRFDARRALQRLVSLALLTYVVEAGEVPYYVAP